MHFAIQIITYAMRFSCRGRPTRVFSSLVGFALFPPVPPCRYANYDKATLKDVGLTEKENQLTKTLSGGQKRKLSVGIALIGGSNVVFLGTWALIIIIIIIIMVAFLV